MVVKILVIGGCIAFFFVILFVLWKLVNPEGMHISYSNDPDPNCPDCSGTGVVVDDVECPCTMRFHRC